MWNKWVLACLHCGLNHFFNKKIGTGQTPWFTEQTISRKHYLLPSYFHPIRIFYLPSLLLSLLISGANWFCSVLLGTGWHKEQKRALDLKVRFLGFAGFVDLQGDTALCNIKHTCNIMYAFKNITTPNPHSCPAAYICCFSIWYRNNVNGE